MTRLTVLMGLRGSGKTTVGRLLAERLGTTTTATDLDDVTPTIVSLSTCAEVIEQQGWSRFRLAEAAALDQCLNQHLGGNHDQRNDPSTAPPLAVLSLGGGTPTAPGAASMLTAARSNGALLVYLHTSPEHAAPRVKSDTGDRPRLAGASELEEARTLYAERDPLYRSLADHVIDTDELEPEEIRDEIAALLR
ncbi:MAG: shikimate kinase [Planctomycetota bacterium]